MDTKKLLAGAALVTLSAGLASPAAAVTGTGNISAFVVQPITLSATQTMNFGDFADNAAGTITMTTGGAVTHDAGATDLGGTQQAGQFTVTGDTRAITLTVDTSAALAHSVAGTMTVTGIVAQCPATQGWSASVGPAAVITCQLDTAPGQVRVAGNLKHDGAEAAGLYQGTYNLVANY